MMFEHQQLQKECLDQVDQLALRFQKLLSSQQRIIQCTLNVGQLYAHSLHCPQEGDESLMYAHFHYKVQCEAMIWKVDFKIIDPSNDHELLSKVFKESFEAWIWKHYYDFCAPLVFQDDLTHVYNYRKLVYDLQNLISLNNQQEKPRPFSLIFMDIDDLKKINNKYGHRTGSQLIRDLATKLRHDLNDEYIIYRYGGDEFILLVEGKDPQLVMQELELIQNRLSSNNFTTRHGHQLKLTFSLGVVQYPQHGISLEELIDLADSMMYHAKKVGGKKILTPEEFKIKTA